MQVNLISSLFKPDDEGATTDRYLDQLLEINCFEIEKGLKDKFGHYHERGRFNQPQLWYGLGDQLLQTPYSEIYEFCSILKDENIKSIIDFGSGYGRVGIVASTFFPQLNFLGYEMVSERVAESLKLFERFKLNSFRVLNNDITDNSFFVETSDIYFIYDFSEPEHITELLKKIELSQENQNYFIVARGKAVRSIIQYKFKYLHQLYSPYHSENFSIYSSFKDLR